MWRVNLIFLLVVSWACSGLGDNVYFGILIDDPKDETVIELALNMANELYKDSSLQFASLIENGNSYSGALSAKVSTCSLLSQQALVIFGPKNPEEIDIVHSICDYKNIAHVVNTWVPYPLEYSTINFYPHSSYLTIFYSTILRALGWKSFTLLYEDDDSLLKLGDLISSSKNTGIIVAVKQLDDTGANSNFRPTLKDAVNSGERNFVIDCKITILDEVLSHAQQVGLMTSFYNFFITNMDLQTLDLEPFQYSGANITGIRMFEPSQFVNQTKSTNSGFQFDKMTTESALLFDSIQVLAEIISNKLSFQEISSGNVSCDSLKSSRYGYTIANHVKTSKTKQITGWIEFDANGFRSNFNLDIIEIKDEGIVQVGTWNSSFGLKMNRPTFLDVEDDVESLRNKTFKVITCLTDPYCMLKETSTQLTGNGRFEGFAIDLIHELSLMEGFNYTFLIREDKANGKKEANGRWSGMIGDVIDGVADLAITDLTITADRETAVDFTSPFMNLGISILAQKPKNAPPSFFSFADPFALETWMMLALAYVLVTLSFFVMGRLCQDEWTNPYPCVEEPEYLINQFSLQNSAWFAVGALMQQGTEIAPIAFSTRMVTGIWWFFVLIMVSSYTASLAAFLATENPINLFTDVNSLVANQEKYNIRMGAKEGGATYLFFKGKDDEVYKAIAKYMDSHPEDMAKENKFGVQWAKDRTYAFFMESTSIEYETQRNCDLQQYGKTLDDKGYGIAMRKNSTYRKRLSTAILKLQSSGELDKLKRKWWEEKRGGGQCAAAGGPEETPPLGVQNVQGVFYVTVGGTILAVFIVIIQMLFTTYKVSKKAKISYKKALSNEMKAFVDFNSDVKPALKDGSKSTSDSPQESGSKTSNNNLNPAPYGFVPTIVKEELRD